MRILLTGSTGFIGSHTAEMLTAHGHEILHIVRNKVSAQRKLSTLSINHKQILEVDLSKKTDISSIKRLRQFQPEIAIHTAWSGIPRFDFQNGYNNIKHGIAFYDLAKNAGCKKIITTGTCAEYGITHGTAKETDKLQIPGPENYHNLATAKISLLSLGSTFAKENEISFIWLRLFFVYGPRMRTHTLIPYLLNCKKNNVTPKLKNPNGGSDFIYISDVSQAILTLLKNTKTQFSIYNIGSSKLIPSWKVAEIIFQKLPRSIKKTKRTEGFQADISKIKKNFGWTPKVKIEDGIKLTTAYFEKNSQ